MDQALRSLARASHSKDPEALARLRAAEARAGILDQRTLSLLARLGDPEAACALGPDAPPLAGELMECMSQVLEGSGCQGGVVAALAAIQQSEDMAGLKGPWLALVEALEVWTTSPDLAHAARVRAAIPAYEPERTKLESALAELGWAACRGGGHRPFHGVWQMRDYGGLPAEKARQALASRMVEHLRSRPLRPEASLEEAGAYLRRRVELGQLSADAVQLAAYAGDPAAREALRSIETFDERPLGEWLLGLEELSPLGFYTAVCALARLALPALLARYPEDLTPLRTVQYVELRLRGDLTHCEQIPLRRLGEACFRGPHWSRAAARVVFHAALIWILANPSPSHRTRSGSAGRSSLLPERSALGRGRWLVAHVIPGLGARFDLPWGRGLDQAAATRLLVGRLAKDVPKLHEADEEDPQAQVGALVAAQALARSALSG